MVVRLEGANVGKL